MRISHRVRALWPKMTWVMPSRFANAMRPSAGRSALHAHDGRAELFGERNVPLQRVAVLRLDMSWRLARGLHVDGVPAGAEAAGDTRAGAKHPRRVGAGAQHTMTRSGMSAGSSPSRCRREAALSPTSSATARSASSRSVEMLVSRKKLASACSTFSGL